MGTTNVRCTDGKFPLTMQENKGYAQKADLQVKNDGARITLGS